MQNIVLRGMSSGQTLVSQGFGGTYTAPIEHTGFYLPIKVKVKIR